VYKIRPKIFNFRHSKNDNSRNMNIGFDAKRAFNNITGLGNYSRTLIQTLSSYYKDNSYFLYTPRIGENERIAKITSATNIMVRTPHGFFAKTFHSFWRSCQISNELESDHIDLYHGLSHELPYNIHKRGISSVVSIHDLIFIRNPEYYNIIDRRIYKYKIKYSCNVADRIVAISEQTKSDIMEFMDVPADKIEVIYQSCDPAFLKKVIDVEQITIAQKYKLPEDYILYVGAITPRKNLLSIVKALYSLKTKLKVPLVVVGGGGKYKDEVKRYINNNKMNKQVLFLENIPFVDFPAIYQGAELFVYPSHFEGFGIPIIEALSSKVPVITSKGSCFAEAGGNDSIYVNSKDIDELANRIEQVLTHPDLRETMRERGYQHAQQFTVDKVAKKFINLYEKIIGE